jgi:hypothetical protein
MKVIAYTPLLYGKDYLRYAIASIEPFVDRHVILYTGRPSYGHGTKMACPDTKEELREIALAFPHVEWYEGQWYNESEHRHAIHKLLPPDTDILLPIDADEVWEPGVLQGCLRTVYDKASSHEYRLFGFVHLWRSFKWACTDDMAPARIIDLRQSGGVDYIRGTVFHFGYAQTVELMRYKWAIHGHIAELRKNWLRDKYINWKPGMDDVHPTCVGTWGPRLLSPGLMPAVLGQHPYRNLEIIA